MDITRFFHTRPVGLLVVAGSIFAGLSWLVAIGPALGLRSETMATEAGREPVDPQVRRGREIYLAEGCGYCHSQFVRPTFVDAPYGRTTVAADYAGQHPPVAGTQRTGPDLSNVGSRQPSWMWNFMHLYDPRSMVQASIMPSFPWLFEVMTSEAAADHPLGLYATAFPAEILADGMVAVPSEDAVALVAYLRSLQQE